MQFNSQESKIMKLVERGLFSLDLPFGREVNFLQDSALGSVFLMNTSMGSLIHTGDLSCCECLEVSP